MKEINFLLIDEIQKQYCLDNQILMMDYGLGLCVDVTHSSEFPANPVLTKWIDEDGVLYDLPPYEEIEL